MEKFDEELAYWVGIVQTDGCIVKYVPKNRKTERIEISMEVSKKSLPMLRKFKEICQTYLKRKCKIWKVRRGQFATHVCVKGLQDVLESLGVNVKGIKPPKWVVRNMKFFGAYLAGIIDGDGNVRVKRKKYPQCAIRVYSKENPSILAEFIRKFLRCAVRITFHTGTRKLNGKIIVGKWYELEFLVSSKNYIFMSKYVIPFLQIKYKRDKLTRYINQRLKVGFSKLRHSY
jgi:hypothetical protein